jgi:hypothetical protein
MPETVNVRAIQALLGVAYLLLAAIALARASMILTAAIATGMMLLAYVTGRTIPDVLVPREAILRACGIGLIVLLIGALMDLWGGANELGWVSVAMAYCAGNRLRAAGLGPLAK